MRRFIFLSGKAVLSRLLPFVFIAGIFCLSSCEDELERGKNFHKYLFYPCNTIQLGSINPFQSGYRQPAKHSHIFTRRSHFSLPTHLIHRQHRPPSFGQPADRGVLTRATPIKDVNMYESSVSRLTRIPVPGAKTKLPTTSTTPQPASPTAAIRFLHPLLARFFI